MKKSYSIILLLISIFVIFWISIAVHEFVHVLQTDADPNVKLGQSNFLRINETEISFYEFRLLPEIPQNATLQEIQVKSLQFHDYLSQKLPQWEFEAYSVQIVFFIGATIIVLWKLEWLQ